MSSLFSIENPATAEWWWKLINHDEMATKCVTFETGASVYKSVVYHEKSTLSTYFVSISMIYGRYVNLFTPMHSALGPYNFSKNSQIILESRGNSVF